MKLKLKNFLLGLAAVLALTLAAAPSALAQAAKSYSGTTSSAATNRAIHVASPKGNALSDGSFRVQYLNVTSDLATATCTIYQPGAEYKITTASGGATNKVGLTSPNGNAFTGSTNNLVLVRRVGADTFDVLNYLTNDASSLTFHTATASAVAANDLVYPLTADALLLVGANAAKEFTHPDSVYNGASGKPVVIVVNGTTLAKIAVVSGKWESNK